MKELREDDDEMYSDTRVPTRRKSGKAEPLVQSETGENEYGKVTEDTNQSKLIFTRFALYCPLCLVGACMEELTVTYAPRKLPWFCDILLPTDLWERIFVCFYLCLAHATH